MEKRKRETSEFPSLEQITESRQAHRRHLSQSTQKVTLAKHQADAVQKVMSAFNIAPPITPSTRTIKGKGAGKGKKSSATQSNDNEPLFGTVHRRVCVSSPTGSGKTLMMMAIIDKLWAAGNHAKHKMAHKGQVLVIVPTLEIAKQVKGAAETYLVKHFGNNISIGVAQGQTRARGNEDLMIAMWQSLHMSPKRLSALDPGTFELVITDECHHAPSHCISRMLRYFNRDVPILTHKGKSKFIPRSESDCEGCKRFNNIITGEKFHVKLLGMSATPDRSDKLETKLIFPHRIEAATFKALMNDGSLTPFTYVGFEGHWTREKEARRAQAGHKKLARSSAQKCYGELNAAIVRNMVLARDKGRRHVLIFCESLALVWALRDAFVAQGISAEVMQGQTTARKRQKIVRDFESGELPVLINCGILIEGADLPAVDCLVIAQPTRSLIRMTQMLGRGARLYEGKQDCLVLDFTVDHKEKKGMQVFSELMGVMKVVEGWEGYEGDEPSV